MVTLMIRALVVLAYVTALASTDVGTCTRRDCLCISGRFYDDVIDKCLVNIANRKTTTQKIADFDDYGAAQWRSPYFAVNGDVESSNNRDHHDYTQTSNGTDQWWQVDLGKTYYVYAVMLWNRIDSAYRLKDVYTLSSNRSQSSVPALETWTVLHYQEKAYDDIIGTVKLAQPIEARHLAVLRKTSGVLSLVEFMAFALEAGECYGNLTCDQNGNCRTGSGIECPCGNDENTGGDVQHCETLQAGECYGDIVCDAERNCKKISGSGFKQCPCSYLNKGNYDGCNALDIDECDRKTDNCHRNAICNNTKGGFYCTCQSTYEGNGTSCEDINECKTGEENECHTHATCNNTDGGHTCECNAFYKGDGTVCEINHVTIIVLTVAVFVAVICVVKRKVIAKELKAGRWRRRRHDKQVPRNVVQPLADYDVKFLNQNMQVAGVSTVKGGIPLVNMPYQHDQQLEKEDSITLQNEDNNMLKKGGNSMVKPEVDNGGWRLSEGPHDQLKREDNDTVQKADSSTLKKEDNSIVKPEVDGHDYRKVIVTKRKVRRRKIGRYDSHVPGNAVLPVPDYDVMSLNQNMHVADVRTAKGGIPLVNMPYQHDQQLKKEDSITLQNEENNMLKKGDNSMVKPEVDNEDYATLYKK